MQLRHLYQHQQLVGHLRMHQQAMQQQPSCPATRLQECLLAPAHSTAWLHPQRPKEACHVLLACSNRQPSSQTQHVLRC